jgi:flagellum-specific peptidoglycan hydrolase FlgJ
MFLSTANLYKDIADLPGTLPDDQSTPKYDPTTKESNIKAIRDNNFNNLQSVSSGANTNIDIPRYEIPKVVSSNSSATTEDKGSAKGNTVRTGGSDMAYNEEKIQSYIDARTSGKAPVSAKDFISISKETGVPVDLMLAQAVQESNIGTIGRAVATKNIFNVGNITAGDKSAAKMDGNSEFQNDWVSGIKRYADVIKNEYFKKDESISADKIISNDFVRPIGGRYAEDPNYTTTIKSILGTIRKKIN